MGLAVHTAARICFASHGAQILLSGAVHQAVHGSEPAGITFRELGRFQLQGIPDFEALLQVEAADLPAEFPAPRIPARPSPQRS
jgi:class 3 adenylate cyclase